jgi:tight adherence protein B
MLIHRNRSDPAMAFDFDPIYLIWLLVAVSAGLTVEAVYLLCLSTASYRSQINRRLMLSKEPKDGESVLIELRRERGLTKGGDYRINSVALNRLILQSGITIGFVRLVVIVAVTSVVASLVTLMFRSNLMEAVLVALVSATVLPYLVLRMLRGNRLKKFGAQFPDALDIIVRSLRAGHPVPIAVTMVGREMPDPIGSEFGMVSDEITYGSDLETAMRNLYCRVGSDDLPLFITAVGIQGSTGGNLGEILENLSGVIRQRFKMRRKIRALAAEGRASAMILSALPIGIFFVIQMVAPDFYGSVWHEHLTKVLLSFGFGWMMIGNLIMFKMVNFRI